MFRRTNQAKLIEVAADMEQYVREAINEAYEQGKEDAAEEWEEWIEGHLTEDVKCGNYPATDYLFGDAYLITVNNLEHHLEEMDNGK